MQQCKDYATSLWAKSNCHNSLKICHSLQAFSVMFWLFARDNEQIVLTYFRWPWLCTYERICRIMRYHLMEQVLLQRSAKINVFPEFKPTLMNHTSNTVDKILTIIVGLIFFISFQALVLNVVLKSSSVTPPSFYTSRTRFSNTSIHVHPNGKLNSNF